MFLEMAESDHSLPFKANAFPENHSGNIIESTAMPGPFAAQLWVKNLKTGAGYKWENASFETKNPLTVNIPQIDRPTAYEMRLTLDGVIACAGKFSPKATQF